MNQNSDTDRLATGSPILVTGATGDLGGRVARLLADSGCAVRAMYRHPDQVDRVARHGVTPVRASFHDRAALAGAMAGCERLFLLTPPTPDQSDLVRAAIDVARQNGVEHIVRISAGDSNTRSRIPWARAHAWADHYLEDSGAAWTVLRPTGFMQNFAHQAAAIRRGLLLHTSWAGVASWIDTADVADVACHVLTHAGHDGATYFLTGPEPLSIPQVAERFSAVLGRRVRDVPLPSPLYALAVRLGGQSWFTAMGLRRQFADVVRAHTDTDTTHEVRRLTGRDPHGIDSWISDNIDLFR